MNQPSPDEVNDFLNAAIDGDDAAVKKFVDQYPSAINQKDPRGNTALICAARFGYEQMVKILLDKGAAVNFVNNAGCSALSYAETAVIAEMLIKKGADVDLEDDHGRAPLVYAKTAGIVDVLLKHGAEIDRGDEWTALLWAAYDGKKDVVVRLLEKGADIKRRDSYGYDAVMLASEGGHDSLVKLLQEWPKKQQQRLKAKQAREHKKWLTDTDFSKGLKKSMRAPQPIISRKAP